MNSFVVDTNKKIKTKEALVASIAKSTVASFKLEGITLTYDEAYKMASKSASKFTLVKA